MAIAVQGVSGSTMPRRKRDIPVGTAKIEDPVLRDAKIVASYRGITLTEYLTEMIRPLVKRDLIREQAKKAKETAAED